MERLHEERVMPAISVRNISEETHRALKKRATENGRSTEAEIRDILDRTVRPTNRVQLGSELAAIGRRFGGVDLATEPDKTPTQAVDFE